MIYNELEQRGTADFPVEFYHLDENHVRYHMSAHWHSELELIRVLDGELSVRLNKSEYTAKKGDIFFVNPETVHSAVPDNCVYECIVMHMDFLCLDTYSCSFFIESILNRDYSITEFNTYTKSEFNQSVNEIFDALKHKSSGYKFRVIAALYKTFGIIVDEHMYSQASVSNTISNDKNMLKLKKVLTFIRTNHIRQITLQEMSDTVGMSLKYFCSFFKDMTGKTPVEYLNEYRIERATQKLISTDNSVIDIAYGCGFNDLSYFIKTFKRIKGISPGSFRKK